MDKRKMMDITFEYNRIGSLINLLGKTIYVLLKGEKYKFEISDIKISNISNSEVKIYIIGQPLTHTYYSFYHDEIELDIEDLGKTIFYNEKALNEYKRSYARSKQITLFGECL